MSKVMKGLAAALLVACCAGRLVADASATVSNVVVQSVADGSGIGGSLTIGYAPHGTTNAVVTLDGKPVIQSGRAGTFVWQPQTTGSHTLAHTVGPDTLSATYTVEASTSGCRPSRTRRWRSIRRSASRR